MRLKKFDIIRHKEFKDIALELSENAFEAPNGSFIIRDPVVMNQGWIKTYYIGPAKDLGFKRMFRIKVSEFKDWEICLDQDTDCIRHVEWGTI